MLRIQSKKESEKTITDFSRLNTICTHLVCGSPCTKLRLKAPLYRARFLEHLYTAVRILRPTREATHDKPTNMFFALMLLLLYNS